MGNSNNKKVQTLCIAGNLKPNVLNLRFINSINLNRMLVYIRIFLSYWGIVDPWKNDYKMSTCAQKIANYYTLRNPDCEIILVGSKNMLP